MTWFIEYFPPGFDSQDDPIDIRHARKLQGGDPRFRIETGGILSAAVRGDFEPEVNYRPHQDSLDEVSRIGGIDYKSGDTYKIVLRTPSGQEQGVMKQYGDGQWYFNPVNNPIRKDLNQVGANRGPLQLVYEGNLNELFGNRGQIMGTTLQSFGNY